MKLTGDPNAIAALKHMHQQNPGFMKALIDDARTTTDHITYFRDDVGRRYKLSLHAITGDLHIEPYGDSVVPKKPGNQSSA